MVRWMPEPKEDTSLGGAGGGKAGGSVLGAPLEPGAAAKRPQISTASDRAPPGSHGQFIFVRLFRSFWDVHRLAHAARPAHRRQKLWRAGGVLVEVFQDAP